MNRPYIRNYLVVAVAGVFCWLNTSLVAAQTATNLDCAWCVDPGEVGWGAVPWASLDPLLRQRLQATRDDLDALQARVDAVEGTVLDLSELPVIITEPGVYVLDRNWSLGNVGINFTIIDMQVTATIDLRGFEIQVDGIGITVIRMSNGGTVINGRIVSSAEGGTAVTSAGRALVENMHIRVYFEASGVSLLGSNSRVLKSTVIDGGVFLGGSRSSVQSSSLNCEHTCLSVRANNVTVTGNRIFGDHGVGVSLVRGDNNVLSQNTIAYYDADAGLVISGNDNLIFDNSFEPVLDGGAFVAIEIDGSGNVIDENMVLPGGYSRIGIQFLQDGNFYGDNRVSSTTPFDLGGTTQTDWGGNVSF